MATKIYNTKEIYLFDGTKIEISPLKIKYLREFMDVFAMIKNVESDDEAISILTECTRICMKQYYPKISESLDDIEDNIDMPTMNDILDAAAGVRINKEVSNPVKEQAEKSESGNSWEDLDLVKLESEAFILGIWKNYDDLELNISMPELMTIISNKRDLDYQEKKFMAAIQGVDLDGESDNDPQKKWEDMKARVFSRGMTDNSNDVLALQGQNAKKAGFGIGYGLDYIDLRNPIATE